ncbi:LysR family transcriptional regulator [Allosphingosinicella indica]|uniref:LysR family transcriptional regulator, regulator of gene expression of beta-lactamase n=1 Tax=Allosphingosinicella indica TaxID=941907 RepID=A0A1X7H2S8_9SPHN|nr:LysR family transcriptional regulator [Allosphingosinicella indica]SMF77918.1 LysR family transcriptional regulator, regulator of gene expression of beta-lactamase [Allosphingosinicella indica]
MIRPNLPLNALRAFEAAGRHLSFTNAAIELCVTPAALSHQVKALEERLGALLFRRLPRGLALTDEGRALMPALTESFDRIADMLGRFRGGAVREVLSVGVVGTFAVGWLMPRIARFQEAHPFIDLRLLTNNNRVDIAAEGLDYAIRFGDGAWHGTDAVRLFEPSFTPLCSPATAQRLRQPQDLAREILLRSYRADDWPDWFRVAGLQPPPLTGPVFDSSRLMVEAAMQGAGVALAPPRLFERELADGRIVQPFAAAVATGAYWLTRLKSREPSAAMKSFSDWMAAEAA